MIWVTRTNPKARFWCPTLQDGIGTVAPTSTPTTGLGLALNLELRQDGSPELRQDGLVEHRIA